jgi:hypothetical protein
LRSNSGEFEMINGVPVMIVNIDEASNPTFSISVKDRFIKESYQNRCVLTYEIDKVADTNGQGLSPSEVK